MSASVAPFTPKSPDGRPQWRIIFDHLVTEVDAGRLAVGDVIEHEVLRELLDDADHRTVMGRVRQELETARNRSLQTVRLVGYQLVSGMHQFRVSEAYRGRSRRQLDRARHSAVTVDHTGLTAAESAMVDQVAVGLGMLAGALRMTAKRLADHQAQLERLQEQRVEDRSKLRATDDGLAEVKRRLAELEAQRQHP